MKQRHIAYWMTTVLVALVFLSSGFFELLRPAGLMEGMRRLGYPDYLVTILGIWKIPGGIVVLLPRTPRLKEWAYAGMFFDLSGAAASHAFVGEIAHIPAPLVILGIVIASWALRPESRRLGDGAAEKSEEGSAIALPPR